MKKTSLVLLLHALPLLPCGAAITIDLYAGRLFDSTGTQILSPEARWAVILDENRDGNFPASLAEDGSLTAANSAAAYADFSGLSIIPGTMIGGNRIYAVYDVDGLNTSGVEGVAYRSIVLPDAEWSDLSQMQFAIYWFPGLSASNPVLPVGEFEIGGIRVSSPSSTGDIGMRIPAFTDNASSVVVGDFTDNDPSIGGALPLSRFIAITAVPEPSTALLTFLGVFGLLMRRRR